MDLADAFKGSFIRFNTRGSDSASPSQTSPETRHDSDAAAHGRDSRASCLSRAVTHLHYRISMTPKLRTTFFPGETSEPAAVWFDDPATQGHAIRNIFMNFVDAE